MSGTLPFPGLAVRHIQRAIFLVRPLPASLSFRRLEFESLEFWRPLALDYAAGAPRARASRLQLQLVLHSKLGTHQ